jgi:hypothetical protein
MCPGKFRSGIWEWGSSRNGAVVNSLAYCVDMTGPVLGGCEEGPIGYSADVTGPNVRLEYTMHPDSRAPQLPRGTGSHMAPLRGSALVVHLPSNGGGPSMSTPRAKTYLPPGGRCYDCRQCGHLSYTSQHEDDMNRALSKAQAIRERLGGSASMGRRFPAKPKGMWWSTYRRLRASSEDMWVACLHAGLRRHAGKAARRTQ